MDFALAVVVFAPALAVGSFLNVVAARVPLRRSIVRPPSACMSCNEEIAWYDNVPLLSYFLLRGRCRHCEARIPFLYPAVELVTALLLAACVLAFGLTAKAAIAAFFCAVLVAQTALEPSPEWAIAGLAAATFFFLAALAYPAGMGMGDVKLALLMGAALGRTVSVALMVGMLAALVPSVVLLVRHGSKARKMGVPFGPFLAIGSVAALFWGHEILHAYFSTLH